MELRDGARVGLGSLRYYIALRIPTPATENTTHETNGTSHLMNSTTKILLFLKTASYKEWVQNHLLYVDTIVF